MNEMDFFKEATLNICGSLEIEKAMYACFHTLKKVMPVDYMQFELYRPEMRSVNIVAAVSEAGYKKLDQLLTAPKELETMAREVLDKRKQRVIIYDEESAYWEPLISNARQFIEIQFVSCMDLALEYEGEDTGGFTLFSKSKKFSRNHARLLELLQKPFEISLANYFKHNEVLHLKDILADDNKYLQGELHSLYDEEIIGANFGLKNIMENVRQVSVLNSPVLLTGETGVGKDVIAHAIHYSSSRKNGPFVQVNCGAIPETLIDSELFGHEKGAFTGALAQKKGRFERADRGTIFLDEIGELPPSSQLRFLKVLQDKTIERVGGDKTIPLDIRIIAATNRNLEELVKEGKFREDLWYRLNVFPIRIPPLRERRIDIPALVHHFINSKTKELKSASIPSIAPGSIDDLMEYHWPGNVRELQNVIERALILNPTGPLTFKHLNMTQFNQSTNMHAWKEKIEKLDETIARHIRLALKRTNGRIHGSGGAAELLGVNPNTLRSRIKKLKIHFVK
jgi:transcriptional regulator with GAF, ATPase, and Fis domain